MQFANCKQQNIFIINIVKDKFMSDKGSRSSKVGKDDKGSKDHPKIPRDMFVILLQDKLQDANPG
ncbi:19786_t:CDS:2 [Funneliformis geosporum]|uniref:17535_t:CDS:1 n=1 Tax=Funneliformis geosporum TaxID=1117311 RepID=A0A9W4WW89_9GLOM|nr:19786_t:CDS:2 [Funneliformis geosporum]CAI2183734.1 17535_t:CDS:2 [Funneliformis geosporum]